MEPITLNLPDLGQWALYGWLAAYTLATVFFGCFSHRHIRLAGAVDGESAQNAHIATSIVSGIAGAIVFIATLCSANGLFNRSIRLADKNLEVVAMAAELDELEQDIWKRKRALAARENECICGAPFDEDGSCERLVAQFSKQAVDAVVCATKEME